MAEGKWIHQISLLTFLVIIFSLTDFQVINGENSHEEVSTPTPIELKQPKLIVFSLDWVIWPFRVESEVVTPVRKDKRTGRVHDFVKKALGVYADALDALNTLYLRKYRLAAISDSPDVETNTKLLLYFNLYNYFPIQEMFGGPKSQHLELIHRTTQIPYQDIIYFDVKNDQLTGLRKMGLWVVEVESGLSIQDFDRALGLYNNVTTPAQALEKTC
uniref:Uncharacterized protein n=1 Tax=Graphocephala atropunctata TaxID=36148 RepID=A0A1B6K9L5_9HEMI